MSSDRAHPLAVLCVGICASMLAQVTLAATFTPRNFTPSDIQNQIPKLTRDYVVSPSTGVGHQLFGGLGGSTTYELKSCGKYLRLTVDPYWDRLTYAINDWRLGTYGTSGAGDGQFSGPRDIDAYYNGNLAIADTGNDRVVLLTWSYIFAPGSQIQCDVSASGNPLAITYLGSIDAVDGVSLKRPLGVSVDDGGTPTETVGTNTDDIVWIADSGNHRIWAVYVDYAQGTVTPLGNYGSFGTNQGQFSLPKRVVRGRIATGEDPATTRNSEAVYVLDAANKRIVLLQCGLRADPGTAQWIASTAIPDSATAVLESVSVDAWGNVYVTDGGNNRIVKFSASLELLDLYGTYGTGIQNGQMAGPHDFRPLFRQRNWTTPPQLIGTNFGALSEDWDRQSGGQGFTIGVHIPQPTVRSSLLGEGVWVSYVLTEHAFVRIDILNSEGSVIRTLDAETTFHSSGRDSIFWDGRLANGSDAARNVAYSVSLLPRSAYTPAADSADIASAIFTLPLRSTIGGGYMFLDSNGNGLHDDGDTLNAVGSTTIDVWLKTNQNRNGSAALCDSSGSPNKMSGYSFVLRAVGGTVGWDGFVNRVSVFTTALGEYDDDSTYYANGMNGSVHLDAGTYRLASITVTPRSGLPSIVIAASVGSKNTAFGSSCPGVGHTNRLLFGVDWFDADGIGEVTSWGSQGVVIYSGPGSRGNPRVISDGSGGAILTWEDTRGGDATHRNIYVQRVDNAGRRLWEKGGLAICSDTIDQQNPRIVSDGAGGAIVAWMDFRSGDDNVDIYAQRVNSSGVAQWTPNGVPVCVAPRWQRWGNINVEHSMVGDGANGAILVWEDARNNLIAFGDIFAQRLDPNGVRQWGANGTPVSYPFDPQGYDPVTYDYAPVMASDGSGGAIFGWMRNYGDESIYLQRFDSYGAALEPIGGQSVRATGGCQYLDAAPDGTGGVVLAWDEASGSLPGIHAQRLVEGAAQWGSSGTLVAGSPSGLPVLVPDLLGGVIIGYWGGSAGQAVKAQRLDLTGSVKWVSGGVEIGAGASPSIVGDGTGGAIVAWIDSCTVSAQRLMRSNGVGTWLNPPQLVQGIPGVSTCSMPAVAPDGVGGAFLAWSSADWYSTMMISRIAPGGSMYPTDVPLVPAPPRTSLGPIYPNPFNPTVTIQFALANSAIAQIRVFDTQGRLVRRLVDQELPQGTTTIRWDGTNDHGRAVASGVYYCQLSTGAFKETRKVVLAR